MSSLVTDESSSVLVYPNPSNDVFIISSSLSASEMNFELLVYDATGRLIFSSFINENHYEVDAKNWSSGLYFLELRMHHEINFIRLVKN
jgi:hypothetical protein